jgi:hypothetical protein
MRIRDTRYLSHRTSFENRESPLFLLLFGVWHGNNGAATVNAKKKENLRRKSSALFSLFSFCSSRHSGWINVHWCSRVAQQLLYIAIILPLYTCCCCSPGYSILFSAARSNVAPVVYRLGWSISQRAGQNSAINNNPHWSLHIPRPKRNKKSKDVCYFVHLNEYIVGPFLFLIL